MLEKIIAKLKSFLPPRHIAPIPAEERKYVDFYSRVLATIIDIFLSLLILAPFVSAGGTPPPAMQELMLNHERGIISDEQFINMSMDFMINGGGLANLISHSIIEFIIAGFIVILFWISRGGTPGKMLMRMRIIDEKTGGEPTGTQYIIRYFGYILSGLPLFLGFMWILLNKKRRAWHDIISGTVLVYTKKKS